MGLHLTPQQNAAAALSALRPDTGRRDVLMQVQARGRASLLDQTGLRRAADCAGPEFAYFELRTDGLRILCQEADLDEIDRAGALRLAANALNDEAEAETLSAEQREVAASALVRLYAYAGDWLEPSRDGAPIRLSVFR